MKRWIALVLAAVLLALSGCAAVGDIAGNVAQAASEELKNQVQKTLQQYTVDVVEMKTAFGSLNDEGGKLQFFCAVLVKCETESVVQACVDALGSAFDQKGMAVQTGPEVVNDLLTKKQITFDHADYTDGTYYLIYGYKSAFEGK